MGQNVDTQLLLTAAAVVISIVSLFISVWSAVITQRSLRLTQAEFVSQRSAIWQGTVDEENRTLFLKAIDQSIALQRAEIIFPPQLDLKMHPVLPPNYDSSLLHVRWCLQDYVRKRVPRKEGFAVVSLDSNIPVVIESQYVAKGDTYYDKSLYTINYTFVVHDNEREPPDIQFSGLIFVRRLESNEDTNAVLASLFTQIQYTTNWH